MREIVEIGNLATTPVDGAAFSGILGGQAAPTVQTCFNIIDSSLNARVPTWVSGVAYKRNSLVKVNGILLICAGDHTASAQFSNDLVYWTCAEDYGVIVRSVAHGLSRFSLVARASNGFVAATTSSDQTLCTHVVLYAGTDWFLAVERGVYTFAAHGLTGDSDGNLWAATTSGAYASTMPTSGIRIRAMQVIDANTVAVTSYEPCIRVNNFMTSTGKVQLMDVDITGGITYNSGTISLPSTYKYLECVSMVASPTGTYTTQVNLTIAFNQDSPTLSGVTRHSSAYAAATSSNTNVYGALATSGTGFIIGLGNGGTAGLTTSIFNLRKPESNALSVNIGQSSVHYSSTANASVMRIDRHIFTYTDQNEVINRFRIAASAAINGNFRLYGIT